MKRFLLFLLVAGCTTLAPASPPHDASTAHLLDSTMALVDDGHIVCAATWLSQTELITAAHCVMDKEGTTRETVEVAFREDVPRELGAKPTRTFVGAVDRVDDELDLATITASVPPHSFAAVAEEDSPVGDRLRIVGHPVGLTWTFMEGTSNGLRMMMDSRRMLQVIAPVFFGSSGGGAFNERGELVGVCSFIIRAPEQSFFVPASAVRAFRK